MLELEHRIDSFASEYFRRVLIDEIVAALDGVEHVPLPVIFLDIAEGRADATLGRSGVRPRWIELADNRDIGLAGHLDGRHQASAACADDDRVVAVVCHGEDLRAMMAAASADNQNWRSDGQQQRYLMVGNGIIPLQSAHGRGRAFRDDSASSRIDEPNPLIEPENL